MTKLFRYGAVASIVLLSAGSAAFAQNYNPNYGAGDQGWGQSSSSWNRSGSDWNRTGMQDQGWRQGGWNQGRSGATQGYGGSAPQGSTQGSGPSAHDAYQELSKYGYNNIQGMERSQGWEARATRNGDRVHVFIDDDGSIATYRGP
jgi:hypothetical protein